jgi:hypothetical protein
MACLFVIATVMWLNPYDWRSIILSLLMIGAMTAVFLFDPKRT